jgi:hypothetical protein
LDEKTAARKGSSRVTGISSVMIVPEISSVSLNIYQENAKEFWMVTKVISR